MKGFKKNLKDFFIRNEIFFSVISSFFLSIMAIILSYYTYRISEREMKLLEFQAKPNFKVYLKDYDTDNVSFVLKYDDTKFKSLDIHKYTLYNVAIDSVKFGYGSTRIKNLNFFEKDSLNDESFTFDLKNNIITIKEPDFVRENLITLKSHYNKKLSHYHSKNNGYRLVIKRACFFRITYRTFLDKKNNEYYYLNLPYYLPNYKSNQFGYTIKDKDTTGLIQKKKYARFYGESTNSLLLEKKYNYEEFPISLYLSSNRYYKSIIQQNRGRIESAMFEKTNIKFD